MEPIYKKFKSFKMNVLNVYWMFTWGKGIHFEQLKLSLGVLLKSYFPSLHSVDHTMQSIYLIIPHSFIFALNKGLEFWQSHSDTHVSYKLSYNLDLDHLHVYSI